MTYPGGKSGAGVYQTIINQIPPHEVYIEPFVGGGGVFRNIRRARSSIVIDSEPSAIAPYQKEFRFSAPAVIAVHGDGLRYLERHKWTGREFVYADPPYLKQARKSQRDLYIHEWDTADHVRFLKLALELPCSIAISGYNSRLYMDALHDWRFITFTAQTRRGPATEYLWMNYPEPSALHDCQYLGSDFRERERIKRKAARWAANFEAMPALERQAILSAMLSSSRSCIAGSDDDGHLPDPIAASNEGIRQTPLEMAISESLNATSDEGARYAI